MKNGFTLLELLVASLLLGMLVSILTTIFSQSSIAWSTGEAGVVELNAARRDMAELQVAADNLLDKQGRSVQSVFRDLGSELNERACTSQSPGGKASSVNIDNPGTWSGISVGGAASATPRGAVGDGEAYAIGVRSAGPDRRFGTWDDITTWPPDGTDD